MTQKEIKENLPMLPLHRADGSTIDCVTGMHVLDCYSKDYHNNVDEAMQHAIVHAINNTYGKNINPESVSEMYNALKLLAAYFEDGENYDEIQNILNKATL